MEGLKTFHLLALIVATFSVISVNGQINTPCTTSMISSFTPCINFITGSTSNGSSTPTQSCCDSFKSLTSASMDCACLVITANVPVQLPINRTLSLSLPRACNMGGVPVQCKASGSPLPAPGPALLGQTPGPVDASPLSPQASKAVAPAPVESEAPTRSEIRPVLTPPPPSASHRSYISPPSILLLFIGIMIFNCH
ncbi:Non-specific lipid-transfer protein-like protein [Melia azedarach]|uniref:Non-specific lipid-transfer protein-like protein n=1 Tax=Melia azedarach TaxID=155640 RepID=A0ACC1YW69_MELAZ|nr:Non-specific lipid-transfer protein-like protein [Melia azedarach]